MKKTKTSETIKGLEKKLVGLSKRNKAILSYRFGLKGKTKTLEETGKEFGITRERVRQIEGKVDF